MADVVFVVVVIIGFFALCAALVVGLRPHRAERRRRPHPSRPRRR